MHRCDRNIDHLTAAQMHNLDMCPDQELNLQPFGAWDDAPSNQATQPGQKIFLIFHADSYCISYQEGWSDVSSSPSPVRQPGNQFLPNYVL